MALIVAFTNIIPYIGPIIGGAPAVIVALFDSPTKALLVVVVILIAQQVKVMCYHHYSRKKFGHTSGDDYHYLTAAGNLAGVLGMVFAIPFYAVMKTIVLNLVKFLRARKNAATIKESPIGVR